MPEEAILDAFLAGGEGAGAATEGAAQDVAAKTGENVQVAVPDATKQQRAGKRRPPTLKSTVGLAEQGEKAFGAIVPSADDIPLPSGGVAVLLGLALLIVFAVMPAYQGAHMTRLQLIWASFLGNATLGPRVARQAAGIPGGGQTVTGSVFGVPPSTGTGSQTFTVTQYGQYSLQGGPTG